jgi:multicomponent Na+:H+ antiporter subunit D
MLAGIILALLGGIDEIGLRGRGRDIWPAGIALALAALLLGGAPVGLLDDGARLIDTAASESGHGWIILPLVVATACTGGGVLRATGRIFLGMGELAGEEERAPSEEETEKANRPLWLMLLPVGLLLILALGAGTEEIRNGLVQAAARFIAWDGGASFGQLAVPPAVPPRAPPHPFVPWLTIGLAILIAAHDLTRGRLPGFWVKSVDFLFNPAFIIADRLHSGVIGDYVAWIVVGLAVFGLAFAAIVS